MTKQFISLLVGLSLTTPVIAADKNEDDTPRHEISLSWGAEPYTKIANDVSYTFSKILISGFTKELKIKNRKSSGVFNLDYNYHVLPWLALGGNISYSMMKGNIDQESKTGESKSSYTTIMGNVKMDWHRREHITLYSRLSAGMLFESSTVTSGSTTQTESGSMFMGQISPFGIELGSKNVRFFSEIGFGQAGVFQAGLRVRL